MPILIDVDKEKECIVKEYIDGPILIDLIANNNIGEKHISEIFANGFHYVNKLILYLSKGCFL